MAQQYKKFQIQGTASTGTYVTLYTTPAQTEAMISTILVCNTSASPVTIRIGMDDGVGTPDSANGEWLIYDLVIDANDTVTFSLGVTMQASKYIRVSSSDTAINFTAFVMEVPALAPTTYWTQNGSDLYYTSGNVGIGTTSPDGTLHVHTASAGTVTANAIYDDLVVENSSNPGMTLLGPDAWGANYVFGCPSNNAYAIMGAFYNAGSPYMTFDLSGEKMRIDASGNVGIGATSMSHPLVVENAGNAYIHSYSTGQSAGFKIQSANSNFTWYSDTGTNALRLFDNNASAERLRINGGSGVVPMVLDGPINLDDGNLRIQDSAGDYLAITMYNRGGSANASSRSWRFGANMYAFGVFQFDSSTNATNSAQTQTRMYIAQDGNCYNQGGTWGTISDANLKQDIVYLSDEGRSYWQEFAQLRYARFRLKSEVLEDSNAPSKLGLIAQDVQGVFPACVSASESTTDGSIRLAVKSNILEGPIMANVLQEAMTRIETLEAQVAALQGA